MHPGEQYYPQGVRWDDPIARGTLPDLLSKAARRIRARGRRSNSATGRSAMPSWKTAVEIAAAAFLRAGYGKDNSVALFLGNTPDHPVNFFGALKAGARIVHLSPLDGEIALSHKLSDSGARVLVTSNLSALLPTALKFLDKGLLDRLIVCEDDDWGKVGTPQTPLPDNPADHHLQAVRRRRDEACRPGLRSTSMTSRCCNIPAAPPACRRARCSATAISPRRYRSTTSGASRRAPSATPSSA